MLQSVWPLESNLQKSNQYVNSVISVRTVTTPFTQKSEPPLHSCGPHRISGMKHKYSTARGESNGLSSNYIFSTAIVEYVKSPPLPPTLPDNQLWKYFSNVKCQHASEAMQAISSETDQSRGLRFTCPSPQTSLNSTGCFSAATGRWSLFLSVSFWTPAKHIFYSQQCQSKKKIRDRKEGETAWVPGQWQGWSKEEFDHIAWVMTTQRRHSGVRACVFTLGANSVHLPILWVSLLTGNYEAASFHFQQACLLTVQRSTRWPPAQHPTQSPHLPGDRPVVCSTII